MDRYKQVRNYTANTALNLLHLFGGIAGAAGLFGLFQTVVIGIVTRGAYPVGTLRQSAVYALVAFLGLGLRRSAGRNITARSCQQLLDYIEEKKLEDRLREEDQLAMEAYQACPCPRMYDYIAALNPGVGRMIRENTLPVRE